MQEAVKNVTEQLAEAAFSGAGGNDTSSVATNSLLIHLGLIKCEVRAVMMICWNNQICLAFINLRIDLEVFCVELVLIYSSLTLLNLPVLPMCPLCIYEWSIPLDFKLNVIIKRIASLSWSCDFMKCMNVI